MLASGDSHNHVKLDSLAEPLASLTKAEPREGDRQGRKRIRYSCNDHGNAFLQPLWQRGARFLNNNLSRESLAGRVHSAAESMPSLPRVAVCLVGEPRSIGLTAGNLRTNLLDAWDADGFVDVGGAAEEGLGRDSGE